MMLDDFFTRALLAGIGIALVAGPLGCFMVWRRLAYFGDTLAHAGLLGVALAFVANINIMLSVLLVSGLIAIAMFGLQRRVNLSSDALLGLLSHTSLALGLVAIGLMPWLRIDLMGFLFGDILAVSRTDLGIIYCGGALIFGILLWIWRPLFAITVNSELAQAEGYKPHMLSFTFLMLLACFIAISIKIVGVLLIAAMLIIPAAAARRLASTPEQMAVFAALIGCVSVIAGLQGSLRWDTSSGPSIVVAAFFVFLISISPIAKIFRRD